MRLDGAAIVSPYCSYIKCETTGREMTQSFMDRLCDLILAPRALTAWEKSEVLTAFEDTMAVAYAGWHDPVVPGDAEGLSRQCRAAAGRHLRFVGGTCRADPTPPPAMPWIMTMCSWRRSATPAYLSCPRCWRVSNARPGLSDRMAQAFAVGIATQYRAGPRPGVRPLRRRDGMRPVHWSLGNRCCRCPSAGARPDADPPRAGDRRRAGRRHAAQFRLDDQAAPGRP